jgi:hypothetical protein
MPLEIRRQMPDLTGQAPIYGEPAGRSAMIEG